MSTHTHTQTLSLRSFPKLNLTLLNLWSEMDQKWLSFNIFDFVNKLTTDSDCDKRERQFTRLWQCILNWSVFWRTTQSMGTLLCWLWMKYATHLLVPIVGNSPYQEIRETSDCLVFVVQSYSGLSPESRFTSNASVALASKRVCNFHIFLSDKVAFSYKLRGIYQVSTYFFTFTRNNCN